MEHVRRLEDIVLTDSSLVTIGVFDGVHRGHQALIRHVVHEAHQSHCKAVVLTFFPHPDVVLSSVKGRYYLTTPEYRAELLGEMGVDVVVTQSFSDDVRTIRAADYVEKLLHHLQMRVLWVGKDFALGYQREGNVAYLMQAGRQAGFDVRPIELVQQNGGEAITSTLIRQCLEAGDVERAGYLLGRSYAVSGEVVLGDQRGRLIGFRTANMAVWEQQVLPQHGVYAGWVTLGKERFMAVTNVGTRPTFDGNRVTVEPHILDFDRDIYGETLTLTFEKRLRGEQKFAGIDALKAQLQLDVEAARQSLQGM